MPRPSFSLRRTLTCLGCLLAVGAATTWATPPAANRSVRLGDRDADQTALARPADDLILPADAPSEPVRNDGSPSVIVAPASPESAVAPVLPIEAAPPSATDAIVNRPVDSDAAADAGARPVAGDSTPSISTPAELTAGEQADLTAVRQRRAEFGGRRLGSGAVDAAPSGDVRADAPTVADAPPAAADRPFSIPGLSGISGGGWELLRVGLALGVVLALAIGLQRLLRRVGRGGPGRPSGVLEVMARYPVGRGQQLSIIRLGRRLLLVHQHAGAMRTITEVTDPDEVASLMTNLDPGGAGSDFDAMVRDFQTGDGRGLPGDPAEAVPPRPARTTPRPTTHRAAREAVATEDPGVGRLLDRTVGLDDDAIAPEAAAAPGSPAGTPVSPSRLQSALGALRAARRVETGVQSEVEVVDLTTRPRRPRRSGRPGAAA